MIETLDQSRPIKSQGAEGGRPAVPLFAFAGVRKIIGDPHGLLAEEQIDDRVQKLVNVLRKTVGVMDAFQILHGLPRLSQSERNLLKLCRDQIKEMLDEQMPEWDAVCKAIHEPNDEMTSHTPNQKTP